MRTLGAEVRYSIISSEEGLLGFCEFDEDLNGNNGEEYTMPEALEQGFVNSAEYIIAKSKEEVGEDGCFQELISKALEMVCATDENYLNYEVIDLEDGRFVAIIVVKENV